MIKVHDTFMIKNPWSLWNKKFFKINIELVWPWPFSAGTFVSACPFLFFFYPTDFCYIYYAFWFCVFRDSFIVQCACIYMCMCYILLSLWLFVLIFICSVLFKFVFFFKFYFRLLICCHCSFYVPDPFLFFFKIYFSLIH